ncbi:sulfatase family protein [Marinilabilia rubra]|uniref:Heparan N-sulfatase n=1 Tax=Marinilabilia rubra TaxID=2162893 RepID=A0A2U2B619_9BACT|nr:sulfatase [Marinilabilia rubra]PWD98518.1 heparan N-sulfatase [Marinilabilia rubra]
MRNLTKHLVFLLLIFVVQTASSTVFAKKSKPNILIIMADDCTFSDLPLYGGKNVKTPRIDKLASQGIAFNKAYVTMSMCVPCRAELYTGMQPAHNGVCWNHSIARTGTKSIVHYLADLGYRTGIAGKVHASPKDVFPFDMVEGVERNSVSETANYDGDKLKEFISKDLDQPFCLVTALVVPHIPWTVGDASHFDPQKLKLPPYLADTKETRENFARYLAEIEVLDQQVGATLDLLKEANIEENTIVIFTSEQGAQLPFCKWTNWENGVHTGFIVRWPGKVIPGSRTDALVQYADVLPTLIDALDGKPNGDFDGSSFLPVLLGEKNSHRQYAYFMHNNVPEGPPYPIRSITDGEHHYIRNLTPKNLYIEKHLMARMPLNQYWPSWIFESASNSEIHELVMRYMRRPSEELYNLKNDSNEMSNLAGNKEMQPIKNRLSAELDKWMKQQGDPGAVIDSHEEFRNAKKGNHFLMEK